MIFTPEPPSAMVKINVQKQNRTQLAQPNDNKKCREKPMEEHNPWERQRKQGTKTQFKNKMFSVQTNVLTEHF